MEMLIPGRRDGSISAPSGVPGKPRSEAASVLVMDDEVAVRRMMVLMAEQLGYRAVGAANGDEAIDRYRRALDAGKPFAVVVLDLTIAGGQGGRAVLDRLREIDAKVRAVVWSGYSDDPVISRYEEYGFRGRLEKPSTKAEIAAELERVVNGE